VIAYLALSRKQRGQEIFTVPPDGSRAKQLTHILGLSAAGISWSPDGRRLVFGEGISEGHSELEVIHADGTGLHAITHDFAVYNEAAWSPDGGTIAVSSGSGDLLVLRPDGKKRRVLLRTSRTCSAEDLTWSPDAARIAYAYLCYTRAAAAKTWIRMIDVDGGAAKTLLGPTRAEEGIRGREYSSPAWSPTGLRIAFIADTFSGDSTSSAIYSMSAAGGDVRQLGPRRCDCVSPVWSPDGTRIAFLRYGPGHISQIAVMNADGSGAHSVTDIPEGVSWLAWQPVPDRE
jgi:Tol biopolymer transport system component